MAVDSSVSVPSARVDLVQKTIGSVTYEDPYDWLQRDTEESLAWQWDQDAAAHAAVRSWSGFDRVCQSVRRAGSATSMLTRSAPRRLGGRWFWAAPAPGRKERSVWTSESLEGPAREITSEKALAGSGQAAESLSVVWFEPSPDGRFVACGCTSGGAMTGWWRIVDVDTSTVLDLEIPCVAYTGGLPGWLPDATGFYLADRTDDGRHRVRFHALHPGVPPRSERVFSHEEIPPVVSGLTAEVSPDGRHVIALAGPHERVALMLGDTSGEAWRPFLPASFEGECSGVWSGPDTYLARVHDDSSPRGRIVEIPARTSQDPSTWRTRVEQGESVLRAIMVVKGRLAVCDVLHCTVRFRLMDLDGRREIALPLPPFGNSMVAMLLRRFDASEELVFDYETFTQKQTIYHCNASTGDLTIVGQPGAQVPGITIAQHFARSTDGTRIPYFLIYKQGLDRSVPQPALITGYGGFNIALMPTYLGHLLTFIEAGGVFVHSNLRGGSEYGRHWHSQGRLASKWNVFLDLFAVAEKVIRDGVTTPDRLAMTGTSNGGLLAGVAIAHRPDLWRVVVPIVPVFDVMEPVPREPQYAPVRSIYLEDYGDTDDPAMSRVIFSYSPYQSIRAGVSYPAVFMVFGEHDIGCMPFQGRKFAARLQACSSSGLPVHLRVWKGVGHGPMDEETQVAQPAEWLSFVMQQLGMDVQ